MANWNPYANQFSALAQQSYMESEREHLIQEQQKHRENKLQELYRLGGLSAQEYLLQQLGQQTTANVRQHPHSESADSLRYGIEQLQQYGYTNERSLRHYDATPQICRSCKSKSCNGETNIKGRCQGKQEEFNHKLHMLHSARLAKSKNK